MIYISQRQFCDSTDDATCRGFAFEIQVDAVAFTVRNNLDQPGEFTVVSPKAAGKSPQCRQLVDYLASVLGGQRMFLYDAQSEKYREIDFPTLEFKTGEICASTFRPETPPEVRFDTNKNDWFRSFLVEPV